MKRWLRPRYACKPSSAAFVKALVVDEATTRPDLWRAMHYYQQHDGHLGAQVPLDFLSLTQRA